MLGARGFKSVYKVWIPRLPAAKGWDATTRMLCSVVAIGRCCDRDRGVTGRVGAGGLDMEVFRRGPDARLT